VKKLKKKKRVDTHHKTTFARTHIRQKKSGKRKQAVVTTHNKYRAMSSSSSGGDGVGGGGIPDRHADMNLPKWGVPGLGWRESSPVWSDLLVFKWLLGLCVGFPIVCLWMKANARKDSEVRKSTYLAAFQLVYLMPTFHVIVKASRIWYLGDGAPLSLRETTAYGRVFEPVDGVGEIAKIVFASQIWKFFISMGEFELAWPEFLGSQMLTVVLSYWTMSIPYMQYYAVYYFGVCEWTNLPLAAIDLGRYYPSIGAGMAGVLGLALKVLFASLFVYFRVFTWFFMSKQVYEDTMFILDAKNLPAGFEYPCPREVVYGVVVMLGLFTLLNVAWLLQIAKEAKTTLFGGAGKKKKKGKSSSSGKSSAARGQPPARRSTRSSARKKTN